METQDRIRRLTDLYRLTGSSEFIDQALEKIFLHARAEAERDVLQLQSDLAEYERRLGIHSAEFLRRFEAGEMGDTADVIEWVSVYRMYLRARKRLTLLSD